MRWITFILFSSVALIGFFALNAISGEINGQTASRKDIETLRLLAQFASYPHCISDRMLPEYLLKYALKDWTRRPPSSDVPAKLPPPGFSTSYKPPQNIVQNPSWGKTGPPDPYAPSFLCLTTYEKHFDSDAAAQQLMEIEALGHSEDTDVKKALKELPQILIECCQLSAYEFQGGHSGPGMLGALFGAVASADTGTPNTLEKTADGRTIVVPGKSPDPMENMATGNSFVASATEGFKQRALFHLTVGLARQKEYAKMSNLWETVFLPRLAVGAGPVSQQPIVTVGPLYERVPSREKREVSCYGFGNPGQILHHVAVKIEFQPENEREFIWYAYFELIRPGQYVEVLTPHCVMRNYRRVSGKFTIICDEAQNWKLPMAFSKLPLLGVDNGGDAFFFNNSWPEDTSTDLASDKKYDDSVSEAADGLLASIKEGFSICAHPLAAREKLAEAFAKGQLYTGTIKGQSSVVTVGSGDYTRYVPQTPTTPISIRAEPFDPINSKSVKIFVLSGTASSPHTNIYQCHFVRDLIAGSALMFNGADPNAEQPGAGLYADHPSTTLCLLQNGTVWYNNVFGNFELKPVNSKGR